MATITVYGIPNCDTTKKALQWLTKNNVVFTFHDYKKEGISKQKLDEWCNKAGWAIVFNKRSTTWRELPEAEQKKAITQPAAIKVMIQNNSIIKRPILEFGSKLLVGFKEIEYKNCFK